MRGEKNIGEEIEGNEISGGPALYLGEVYVRGERRGE